MAFIRNVMNYKDISAIKRYCGTLPQKEGRGCWLRQRGKRYKGDMKECVLNQRREELRRRKEM